METSRFNGVGSVAFHSFSIESAQRNEEHTEPADLTEGFQHYRWVLLELVLPSPFPTEVSITGSNPLCLHAFHPDGSASVSVGRVGCPDDLDEGKKLVISR